MVEIDSTQNFISQISQQSIFKTFAESLSYSEGSRLLSQSKLVCRNNSDLFFANENLVRCCTINPYATNFRLLDNKFDKYKIRSLEMNSSGSLLAIIGECDVVVVSLPTSITATNSSLLPVKSYKINNIGGQIIKVVWQSVVANDCGLVILNDKSEIKSYDLSLSNDFPQLSVRLNDFEVFKDEQVSSISFGSQTTLSGALTLYISTFSSNIYAIYPFIHKAGKLSTKGEHVDNLLEESSLIVKSIEEKFPTVNLAETLKESNLKRSCIRQYEYVSNLRKKVNSRIAPRKEMRNVLSEVSDELLIVEQDLPSTFQPVLQGPLVSSCNTPIKDIIQISSNNKVSVLVSISLTSLSEAHINYYGQLRPLIMEWKQEGDVEMKPSTDATIPEPKIEKEKKHGYIKPRKGFGFIDLSDESESDTEHHENVEKYRSEQEQTKRIQSEETYWKDEFNKLSLLAVDRIPIPIKDSGISLKNLNPEESKFSIKINGKVIICNSSEWVNEIVSNLSIGNVPPALEVASNYELVIDGDDEITSIALVKDNVTQTGEFLISLRNTLSNNLEIIQITKQDPKLIINNKLENAEDKTNIVYESLLVREPVDELLNELQQLKLFSPSLLQQVVDKKLVSQKIDESSTDFLKGINSLSGETIKMVSKFSTFVIHLNLRILTQLDELKFQVENLNRIRSLEISNEKLDVNKERIERLNEKQDKIDEKIKSLHERIFNSIQKIKYNKTLPLSNAEKSWVREINAINVQINQDTKDSKSLKSIIENLQSQVNLLLQNFKGDSAFKEVGTDISSQDKLKQFQLRQDIHKLRQWLDEESKLIDITKAKIEDNFKALQL